jgi:hypothetical protein
MVRLNPLDNESVHSLNGVGIEPPGAGQLTQNLNGARPACQRDGACPSPASLTYRTSNSIIASPNTRVLGHP